MTRGGAALAIVSLVGAGSFAEYTTAKERQLWVWSQAFD